MKKLIALTVVSLAACGSPTDNPDGGKPSTLRFKEGTPLTVRNPADDADTATPGFQFDVVVTAKNADDANGSVVFRLNDVTRATTAFEEGQATARLTFNTGAAGTNTENLVTVARQSGDDTAIGWLFTVQNQ
ncbi:MAG: hypothetical protein ACO1OB_31010 [Archangium sp.]